MRVKITEGGPYIVTGGIPLREMIITPVGQHYELCEGRNLPQADTYSLCRCGVSQNAPFCDANHLKIGFTGRETASQKPYKERVQDVTFGSTMNLLDDGRCAFVRFCHTEYGNVWNATEGDSDPETRAAAIKAAGQCLAGRLVMTDKQGTVLEEEAMPEIIVLQDPEKGASAGIFVKGPVVVEAADGSEYEVRNRVVLCRCGQSAEKPFCDARHVGTRYEDGFL